MKAKDNEPHFRRCSFCGEIKPKSQFLYIKYFKKRRRICRRCENKSRKQKRLNTERHIRETGVTPGILKKLRAKAESNLKKLKYDPNVTTFSKKEIRRVQWGVWVSRICYLGFFLTFGLFSLSILDRNFWWFSVAISLWVFTQMIESYFCQPRIGWENPILQSLFKEELDKRLEYERFYNSIEWKILRENFLRKQKKLDGFYLCEYCKETVGILDLSVDHFMPRSKYPELALEINNLRVSHRKCNSRKGDKELT